MKRNDQKNTMDKTGKKKTAEASYESSIIYHTL